MTDLEEGITTQEGSGTVTEVVITFIEAPSLKNISTHHVIQFKRKRERYKKKNRGEKQAVEEANHTHFLQRIH